MLNRRVMCGLIWDPRPRIKRPPLIVCKSFAVIATVIGERAKATAMLVPNATLLVLLAAEPSARNGS